MKIFIKLSIYFSAIVLLFTIYAGSPHFLQKNEFQIDTNSSFISWKCSNHFGKLKLKTGNIIYHKNTLQDLDLTVDMNSISVQDMGESEMLVLTLINVLKSNEFFNVKLFPNANFKLHESTYLETNQYQITGDINILNRDICTPFLAKIHETKDSIFFETDEIALDRTDWGILYLSINNHNPKEGEDGFVVSDSIIIKVDLKAYKQKL